LVNHDDGLKEDQLKQGCKKCIENVQNLLDSAKLLLGNENSHQYALGLYVYAIEEYGKATILKNYLNKNIYSIPKWVFGSGKYARKAHFRVNTKGLMLNIISF
jgi:AbiV family abortive infection protein